MWGVTDTMVGASSGAGERDRQVSSGDWALGPLAGHREQILLRVWREGAQSPDPSLHPRAQSPLLFVPRATGFCCCCC